MCVFQGSGLEKWQGVSNEGSFDMNRKLQYRAVHCIIRLSHGKLRAAEGGSMDGWQRG